MIIRRCRGGGEDWHGKLRCAHHLISGRPVVGVWESAITLLRWFISCVSKRYPRFRRGWPYIEGRLGPGAQPGTSVSLRRSGKGNVCLKLAFCNHGDFIDDASAPYDILSTISYKTCSALSPRDFLTPCDGCTAVSHHSCFRVCFCQVGSGFDVSAAVYGTHTYTRFSPSALADALSAYDKQASPACSSSPLPSANGHASQSSTIPTPLQRIAKCVEATGGWDAERGHLRLPPCFRLLMGDVCGGSSTPSMVRKVNWEHVPRQELHNLVTARAGSG